MTLAAELSNSLNTEECDFFKVNLNKIFFLDSFSCINYHLTEKYTAGKLMAK